MTSSKSWIKPLGKPWYEVPPSQYGNYTSVFAINDQGTVCGYSNNGNRRPAIVWSAGRGTREIVLPNGRYLGEAYDVNEVGSVCGRTGGNDQKYHGFVWNEHTGFIDFGIGPYGNGTEAQGINDLGWVVAGGTKRENGTYNPKSFIWKPETGLVDAGMPLGYVRLYLRRINNKGESVGTAEDDNLRVDGYLRGPDGTFTALGMGDAMDINNSSEVVGNSWSADQGDRGVYWSPSTGSVDLNTLVDESAKDWHIAWAYGISDNGYITGYGYYKDAPHPRAYLLVPLIRRSAR